MTMNLEPFLLEHWFRLYSFDSSIVLCSSGVEPFTFGELRETLGFSYQELDSIVLEDSLTLGGQALRQAIAQRWGNGDPQRVMVTNGSSEAIFLVMNGLLQAGDEVVVLTPCYQSLHSVAMAIGCQVKEWRLREDRGFVPDIADARQLIGPSTRAVIVNFPNNPTGAALSPEELQELMAIVAQAGAYFVWDAAFTEIMHDRPPLVDPCLTYERGISLGTLTKAYGLPGLRLGWLLGPPEVLDKCVHIRDYVTRSVSPLVEFIAQRIVEKADHLLERRLPQARANLNLLADWCEQHKEYVSWTRPLGGVAAFLRIHPVADIDEFCHQLGHEHGIFLLPGTCFGYPGYVRLGFGGATAKFQEGLSCLSSLLVEQPKNGAGTPVAASS